MRYSRRPFRLPGLRIVTDFSLSEDVVWNAGYTMGSGTFEVDIPGDCSGSYTVTAVQQ